jgi:hypothetical protein
MEITKCLYPDGDLNLLLPIQSILCLMNGLILYDHSPLVEHLEVPRNSNHEILVHLIGAIN